jgi:choline dehydrogenase-like flavoprotein
VLVDARSIEPGQVVDTDICVVGGGPAGIVIGHELQRSGQRILILESGDLGEEPGLQSLNDGVPGEVDRYTARELRERRRQVGGSAHLWGVAAAPGFDRLARFVVPDRLGFEETSWLPNSGWPIDRETLSPYYERSFALLGLGEYRGSPEMTDRGPFEAASRLVTTISRYASGRIFTETLRNELFRATDVTLATRATAAELELGPDGRRITGLRVCTDGNRSFAVSARRFVLAAGGIENPRLLLMSNATTVAGIGNGADLVGRYFMEHPMIRVGVVIPRDPAVIRSAGVYDLSLRTGIPQIGSLSIREDVRRSEQLQGFGAFLVPRHAVFASDALASLLTLVPAARSRRLPRDASRHVARLIRGLPQVAQIAVLRRRREHRHKESEGGWSQYEYQAGRYAAFQLSALVEQAPDRNNRVCLTDQRDEFGLPKARLDWRWSDRDIDSLHRTCQILADDLRVAGIGRFQPWMTDDATGPEWFTGHHHMGTTRMNRDPSRGVVDENGQVHGIGNLYVAGSSVFPTGLGHVNPTLTIVALAIRLADQLRDSVVMTARVTVGSSAE